jgi:hypothetical protein
MRGRRYGKHERKGRYKDKIPMGSSDTCMYMYVDKNRGKEGDMKI